MKRHNLTSKFDYSQFTQVCAFYTASSTTDPSHQVYTQCRYGSPNNLFITLTGYSPWLVVTRPLNRQPTHLALTSTVQRPVTYLTVGISSPNALTLTSLYQQGFMASQGPLIRMYRALFSDPPLPLPPPSQCYLHYLCLLIHSITSLNSCSGW